MADIDKEKAQLRAEEIVSVLWAVILGFFAAVQIIFVYRGIRSGAYTWDQYFIEYGDSLGALLAAISLALFLSQLKLAREERITALLEAEKDRRMLLKENRLTRKIMLVKEQLDFYSELYNDFVEIFNFRHPDIVKHLQTRRNKINASFEKHNVRKKYPRYVNTDELNVFTDYYANIYRQLDVNKLSNEERDEAHRIIDEVIDHILKKYTSLSEKYRELISQ